MIPYAGTPAEKHGPPEWRDKILHARLMVDGEFLMGSDAPPDQYRKPSGFSVSLNFKEPAEAERIFSALSQQGTVKMPIQETFWALRFDMLVDLRCSVDDQLRENFVNLTLATFKRN